MHSCLGSILMLKLVEVNQIRTTYNYQYWLRVVDVKYSTDLTLHSYNIVGLTMDSLFF